MLWFSAAVFKFLAQCGLFRMHVIHALAASNRLPALFPPYAIRENEARAWPRFFMNSNGIRSRRKPISANTGWILSGPQQCFWTPLALTIPDEEHSETEARWITLGKDATARYVLVVHTFETLADDRVRIRLISARRPTKAEVHNYEEQR